MSDHPPDPDATARAQPILAAPGGAPATASHPDTPLDQRWHVYEPNPAPWWIAGAWIAFFAFGVGYLLLNLAG